LIGNIHAATRSHEKNMKSTFLNYSPLCAAVSAAISIGLLVASAPTAAQPANRDGPDGTPPPSHSSPDTRLTDFDAFVEEQLKKWNTPGAAITVVHNGKVILQRGYGLRDKEKKLPMTAQTLQPIASVTKSFTVASLATLVRDGKLSWDKPVREYLPDFKMHSDYATMNVTPRDMVTHRTGLPRHDWSWFNATASREELYKRIPYLELSAAPRAAWQYNNFMYMTAGYMGGRIAGSDWETLVRNNLFTPLGMRASNFTIEDLLKSPDHGTGYLWDDKEVPQPIPYRGLTAMGPTGSINSNVEDMARYLQMYLNRGQFEGKTILNTSDIVDMTNPQMVMADARTFEEISSTQYGMGFFLTHYRGERLVHHGGNMPGSSSLMSFLPQKGVGVFTTVNLSGSSLPSILSYAVYDRLLGMKPIDWSARFWERKEKSKQSEEAAKKQNLVPRKLNTKPAHALDEYVGEYEHTGYGVMTVAREGNDLRASYNGLASPLKHFHFEVFEAPENKLNELSKTKVEFVTNIEGDVSALRVATEPSVKPTEFGRMPDRALKDPAVLKNFAGEYELGPNKIAFTLRSDNVLTLSIPGQPVRELVGLRGRKFSVKGLNGYTIDFVTDAAGKTTQAAFYQPNGNFVAVKK
jgi:CubicO group peptidase (beta-lactamase class C family)